MFYGEITKSNPKLSSNTLLICSIQTDRSGQMVNLLLKKGSDQGLHCLPFPLHLFDGSYGSSLRVIIPPVKRSFSGIYCFLACLSFRHSVIPSTFKHFAL